MEDASEIDPKLLEILVCPLTKAPLRYDRAAQELISEEAGLAYPIRDGIPIMLVDEARPLRDDEKRPKTCRHPENDPNPETTMSAGETTHWPVELRLKQAEKRLDIEFRRRQAASACRPNICGSKALRPRSRGTGRGKEHWSPGAPMSASSGWSRSAITRCASSSTICTTPASFPGTTSTSSGSNTSSAGAPTSMRWRPTG